MIRRISVLAARRRVTALVAAIGMVTTMFVVTPATAAHADDGYEVTFTSGGFLTPGEDLPDIVCRISIDNPVVHVLDGGGKEIHSLAMTDCSSRVAEVAQHQELFNGDAEVSSDYFRRYDAYSVQTDAYYICVNGAWTSHAESSIFAPPGYFPPTAHLHINSGVSIIPFFTCF